MEIHLDGEVNVQITMFQKRYSTWKNQVWLS